MSRETRAGAARGWDAAQAANWERWFHIIEAGARELSARMLAQAELAPGARVLDVATGIGDPALGAAERAGPAGWVLGTDLSDAMLGHAARRAARLGLGNVAFAVMDAQALVLRPGGFDAALCRWGMMFVADPAAALRGLHRVLKPGGRLVAAIWGPAERVPGVGLGARVVRARLGMAPPEEGAGTPFAFAEVAAFEALAARAGFREVTGEWVNVPFDFASAEEFTRFRRERSGPLNAKIAGHPEAAREAAWAALTEAADAFATADGRLHLDNAAYLVAGTR